MLNNIEEIPEGGRGIQLMLQLVDELSYARNCAHQNCLLLVKKYDIKHLERSPHMPKISVVKWVLDFFNRLKSLKFKRHPQPLGDTTIKKIRLQVNTDINAVTQVLQWFD